ncbi:hypothetical protein [Naasia aerilata]|uniref:Two-component sensor histidine kinase n=1 Tax=Naasia aerilata TaxID=1162966 RepID=A0ABM8GBN4_9MICO|nr:hypothetical protein [Naasia aerilata]BDZ45648.1 hypothetical protein GCM10025866_15570 [Naasia aerilata]
MIRTPSLRLRLVLIVVALLAAVAAVIGVVTAVVLQSYLVGQVDQAVSSAAERASHGFGGRDGDGDGFVLGQGRARSSRSWRAAES